MSVSQAMLEHMFDTMDTAAVESELVTMAGHLAAGTCRFLQLMAEFDTRAGWAGPGLRSCAHWLNWRIGMSPRTARDHLRVAHALADLPAVTAAFAAGRVSYSKVRALTRIATPATEEGLLGIALHGTTSQLESLVAAARAGADPRPARARRGLRWSRATDGSLLVSLRIPAEQGEQLLAAIEACLAATPTDGDTNVEPHEERGSAEPTHDTRAPDDNTDSAGRADSAGGTDSAEPVQRAERYRAWRTAQDEHRERALDHTPGATVEPLAARRLDALLDLVAAATVAHPPSLVVHVRLDDTEPAPATAHRPRAWIDGGPAIPLPTAARLTCTAAVRALLVGHQGNPLHLGRTRRTATPQQLMALRVRDGQTCAFPGCTTTRYLATHHLRWWQWGGTTDLDNLALLCGFHHTLIHDQRYRAERTTGGLAFHRPDGTPIPNTGPPPTGSADDLTATHTVHHIHNWTITPRWGGEHLDRDAALAWLLPELARSAAAA